MSQLLKTEKIESRTYQEVIAASCLQNNTLVVLPTGLGKTVIAAMVASRKLQEGKTLFLAPTKPLAEQHKRSFKQFIDIENDEMQVMTGKIRPDDRYDKWQEKKAFFATPQVVENDLIAGKLPVEDFSLVIFDEAHRATGDYSYNFISEKMPVHKMALTASPGGSKEKIMEVKENLDIESFEVRTEEDSDVKPYIQDREINWVKVSLDNRFQSAKENLEKAKKDQLSQLKKLGQISSININKGDLLKLQGKIGSKLSSSDDPKLYKSISVVATALKISQALEMLETQGVTACYRYMDGLERDDSKAAKRVLANEHFQKGKSMVEYLKKKGEEHPKMDKLRSILGDMQDGEKAIVFTEYRDSTEKIADELNTEGLNAVRFVGQQGDTGMTQKKQAEILKAFDEDKYNVIVSTSIGEEGLDIPAVDYVVFYEPVASGIRDIQRAGRTGRQESGEVFVLMAENTRDEGYYWSAHHKKNRMNDVLQELKEETREQAQQKLGNFKQEKEDTEDQENKKVEEDQIEVIADDRENSIAKELSRMDVLIDKKRLEVADFVLSERVGVERKEVGDFADSLIDNRLFSQLKELMQYEKPVLVIEGDSIYGQRKISAEALRGAIASITIDMEIPIIWTDNQKDTAETLKAVAKREQEEKNQNIAVRATSDSKSTQEILKFIVAGLPSVNTKLAERLLEEFETVEKIFTASEEELKEVEGIGEGKAESIREILCEKYEKQNHSRD